MSFEYHLEDNLFSLHEDLALNDYKHSSYEYFTVFDGKKRDIHKAVIRDRIVHQIIFDFLEEIFEKSFISDSYSSRKNKGSHQAIKTFQYFTKLVLSRNKKQCFVLKCDVKKYFSNVRPEILLKIIEEKVSGRRILSIISQVIFSFQKDGTGIPLGNITSQIFANIYLDKLDSYIKGELKARFYVRYNDDFVILDDNKDRLERYLPKIRSFLEIELQLEVPLHKASVRKLDWGVDFLGYTIMKKAVLLRNKTKAKMFNNLTEENISSYLGLLTHCNSYNLKQKIIFIFQSKQESALGDDFLFK